MGPSPTIAYAQAHQIAESWWPKAEQAFITGDKPTLQQLYAEPALDEAAGIVTGESLSNTRPKYPRPVRSSVVFIPVASSTPQWFLAVIQFAQIDQDGRALAATLSAPGMIFAKQTGAWQVVALNVQAPIPHSYLATNDMTLDAASADVRYILPRAGIASAYASYLKTLRSGQPAEVPFATGPTTFGAQFAHISWPPESTVATVFSFEVDEPELAVYSVTPLGASKAFETLIFVVRRAVTISSPHGCITRRPGDVLWSYVVPPGSFKSVTLTSIGIVAASIPLNDGDTSQGRKVIDISGSVNDLAAVGTNC